MEEKAWRSPKIEILDLISDDSYGLWEITGWLEERVPDPGEARNVAAHELTEMQAAGLVEILHRESFDSPERGMDPDEALRRLRVDRYWQVPQPGTDEDEVRAAATDAGIKYYTMNWRERSA